MPYNVNIILKEFGITYSDMFSISKIAIRKKILEKIPPLDWRGDLIKKLLYVFDGELNIDTIRKNIIAIRKNIFAIRKNKIAIYIVFNL